VSQYLHQRQKHNRYLAALKVEREKMFPFEGTLPICSKLLESEISRVKKNCHISDQDESDPMLSLVGVFRTWINFFVVACMSCSQKFDSCLRFSLALSFLLVRDWRRYQESRRSNAKTENSNTR